MSTATALSPEILAKYQPVIGLEVHVQLLTASKAFCGCVNQYGGEPNTHVCPTCLGLPGALPVLNRKAVEFAVLAAKAINCEIRETSIFSRKNYFYPDSPKGYQISQFDKPIAENGWIDVPDASGKPKRIGVTRLHMEEDAGKSVHDGFADSVSKTYIDLNRCGTPLVEIVSEPDLRTADEVFEYLTKLKEILLYTGVSDCNMEEGSLRCDANVSVMLKDAKEFGTKAEVKNVNSFRYIRAAVEYEIERQIGVLEDGGRVVQESRLWNNAEGRTFSMRSKEQAHDYRYFPEPDLLPVVPAPELIEELRAALPEPPAARRRRLKADWGFADIDFQGVVNAGLLDEVEATIAAGATPAAARKWWLSEISRIANAEEREPAELVSPENVAALQQLVDAGTLTDKLARQVLEGVIAGEGTPQEVVDARGLAVVSDDGALIAAIDEALAAQPDVLAKIRDGKVQAAGAVIGAVMKAMKGQADAARVRELVLERAAAQ